MADDSQNEWTSLRWRRLIARALPVRARDALVRLANDRGAGVLPPVLRAFGGRLWCRYRVVKPLRHLLKGKQVCLFAHSDRDGLIDNYVVYHLSHLFEAGLSIIFITATPIASPDEMEKIDRYCAAIIERENIGRDFGTWRTATLIYPEILDSDALFLTNDSVYGPMRDLRSLIDTMAIRKCDFWGITESLEIRRHYQSYFLAFLKSSLRSKAFQRYFNSIRLLSDRDEIIQRYEVPMWGELCEKGLRGAVLLPAATGAQKINPTLHRWREILAAGAPYLKVQLLRDNPHRQMIDDWPEVVRSYGYDPQLIEQHLRRVQRASRQHPPRS